MLKQITYREFLGILKRNKFDFEYLFGQIDRFPQGLMVYYALDNNIGLLIGSEMENVFTIYRLEINKRFRRRGYGTKLLKKLFIKKSNMKFIVTYLDDAAKLFYQSVGFKEGIGNWHQMQR